MLNSINLWKFLIFYRSIYIFLEASMLPKKYETEDTVKSYNDTIHSVTKATPLEVFWSTNKKFIKSIKNNIINYYYKRSKNTFQFELEEKY